MKFESLLCVILGFICVRDNMATKLRPKVELTGKFAGESSQKAEEFLTQFESEFSV